MQIGDTQLRALAENIPILCWLADPDGAIIWYNRRWYDYTGTTPEAMEGWGWQSVHHPDELPRVLERWRASIATAKPFEMIFPIRGADGEYRSFLTRVEPAFDGHTVTGWFGVNTDITDQLSAEHELAMGEERWRSIFEQMQEAFFVGEAIRDDAGRMHDFRFIQLNPAFEAQTGVPITTAVGRPVREVIPGIPDALIDTYARVIDERSPIKVEARVPALRNRWYEARARPLGLDQFAVLFLDISERKAASDALLASEARFRSLAQSMPNHVWTAPPNGRLDWFNARVYAYSGAQPGDLDGDGWTRMVHPEDLPAAVAAWTNALDSGTAYETEFRLRRHDGAYRWHIARAEPLRDAAGDISLWIGSNTDIDDQKAAESALQDLAGALEQRVAERTRELEARGEQLRQAQKMEAVGQLTGGVAHDFNNLLQVVSGNLQLLAKDIAGNEQAEARVANALAGVRRGARLANQLLAFSRRQPLEPRVVNIGRFVAGMEDLLRRALGESVEIETIVADHLWNTMVDPTQVENALLNLAINARDAMDGRGTLTIEAENVILDEAYANAHAEVTAGDYLMLAVTDTGCGMAPEILAQVFEPFFSTKPEGQGTGLGLSMVYGFVKQSGGHIQIYSEVGLGTTVKLYLRRAHQAEDAARPVEIADVVGGTETILVAEDDDQVRVTVVAMLRDLGYRVLTAPDAAAALAIIDSGAAIDLLFTDVVMPGALRSPDLARLARERAPGLAVLFTSGYTQNAIVHGGRLDAGVELLPKPYTREALARKIRQVLAGQAHRAVMPPPAPARATSPEELTVLLVEDDALICAITAEMIRDLGHTVLEAGAGDEALAILETTPVDILVTDLGLPGMSGGELALKARDLKPDLAVIFATGGSAAPDLPGPGQPAILLRKPYDSDLIDAAIRRVAPSL